MVNNTKWSSLSFRFGEIEREQVRVFGLSAKNCIFTENSRSFEVAVFVEFRGLYKIPFSYITKRKYMKKKNRKKFQPLVHENLGIKNELLQFARNARTIPERTLENDLASVLLYSNIAEYLAENLLENLNHFIYEKTYEGFGGILYIESVSKSRSRTLHQMVEEIEKFNFPDKENILSCFKNIAESRNKLFHSFAKSDIETIKKFLEEDLSVIQDECEEVITKINTIYNGLRKITIANESVDDTAEDANDGKK